MHNHNNPLNPMYTFPFVSSSISIAQQQIQTSRYSDINSNTNLARLQTHHHLQINLSQKFTLYTLSTIWLIDTLGLVKYFYLLSQLFIFIRHLVAYMGSKLNFLIKNFFFPCFPPIPMKGTDRMDDITMSEEISD